MAPPTAPPNLITPLAHSRTENNIVSAHNTKSNPTITHITSNSSNKAHQSPTT
ncbi:hypothetical protein COLO4_25011 [Corchorus olitorius]|uniref:Uncharacterized protein n=1 Tax=Corchorus olitorius TaxID=93759 RepID=A0A1R3I574_9ROSI|nr:hypothetical protein COLO4_25011 [Corchorus olitorius]